MYHFPDASDPVNERVAVDVHVVGGIGVVAAENQEVEQSIEVIGVVLFVESAEPFQIRMRITGNVRYQLRLFPNERYRCLVGGHNAAAAARGTLQNIDALPVMGQSLVDGGELVAQAANKRLGLYLFLKRGNGLRVAGILGYVDDAANEVAVDEKTAVVKYFGELLVEHVEHRRNAL